MGFWGDLGDAITGQTQQEIAASQLQAQLDIIALQSEQEKAELEAKYSPEALKARTRQITIVVSVIGGLLVLFIVGRILKWF